ncbi:Recombination enhancement, RecA-dependent nuclease [Dyella jiangningensis]|uniref:Ref family recombination enhancement nuclease n=1 Tax=Dyella sp. AtDHG13 TaxID=1938897 RepID=UPI000884E11B|nr:Ref family recombination enhancement nuclease [Dyella sp. AtDHG13]PXV60678.1 phage RecA-dependent nuclease [Dyella sp. AtDHG13]SDJ54800.1 Recombination enhancement, RecA-dependent nuclease [Dyella jiangningensis]
MKQTPLKRKTPLRHSSPKKAVTIKASVRRLKQGRSTGRPTAEQERRFEHIKAIGCIACLMDGIRIVLPTEVHHLNQGGFHGGKRRGHDFTIGLCGWHHQGHPPFAGTIQQAEKFFGPSYKLQKMAFRGKYGSDDALLTLQNQLIAIRELACTSN